MKKKLKNQYIKLYDNMWEASKLLFQGEGDKMGWWVTQFQTMTLLQSTARLCSPDQIRYQHDEKRDCVKA